ncbi:MAG TPA: hypothetical protein VMB82_02685 [Acidimicrobiales bacterium]|nr:hypothetical protein [Acidimicrobiales bacterium]
MIVLLALVVLGVVAVGAFFLSIPVRRHGESNRPEVGWTPTAEVFVDPGTARTMRVWLDTSGSRHYVPENRG